MGKKIIPKLIWTWWSGPSNPLVDECIKRWKRFNDPLGYKITVLNYDNINQYMDFDKYKDHPFVKNSGPQFTADIVRIFVLKNQGGIWLDATIILNDDCDFFNYYASLNNAEYVGYWIPIFTSTDFETKSPVIENWCFACPRNSRVITEWGAETDRLLSFPSKDAYIKDIKSKGANMQNISNSDYFVFFCALQYVLQLPKYDYRIYIFDASQTAFKFLQDNVTKFRNKIDPLDDWKSLREISVALDKLIGGEYQNQPLIKITGRERAILLKKKDWRNLFI